MSQPSHKNECQLVRQNRIRIGFKEWQALEKTRFLIKTKIASQYFYPMSTLGLTVLLKMSMSKWGKDKYI